MAAADYFDSGFGGDGIANYAYTDIIGAAASAPISGDRVLSVGVVPGAGDSKQFLITRFDAAGVQLGASSTVSLDLGSTGVNPTSIAIQADGSFYVAGEFDDPNVLESVGFVARVNSAGALDTTFGGESADPSAGPRTGVSFIRALNSEITQPHVAVNASGEVYVGFTIDQLSATNGRVAVTKFNTSGVAINSFSGDGTADFASPGFDGRLEALVVDGSSIVLVGDTFSTQTEEGLNSVNGGVFVGKLDASGNSQIAGNFKFVQVTSDLTSFDVGGAALTASGLVVGGNITTEGTNSPAAQGTFIGLDGDFNLLTSFGDADTGFVNAGLLFNETDVLNDGVAVDADGNIYGVGFDNTTGQIISAVARLDAGGSFDVELDGDGVITYSQTQYDAASTVALDAGGFAYVTSLQQSVEFIDDLPVFSYSVGIAKVLSAVEAGVENTPQTVAAITADKSRAGRGETINFGSVISDIDAGDTFTVTWNFGDGTIETTTGVAAGAIAADHAYATGGGRTVTLTVDDGQGNVATRTFLVKIANYSLSGKLLTLAGSAIDETFELTRIDANTLNINENGENYAITSEVTAVRFDGAGGNDRLLVGASLNARATLIGGDGDDILRGGAASDVLLGDAGNDTLIGRDGRDILVGGVGADMLIGNESDDILISGRTSYASDNFAAYDSIRAEWTSTNSWLVRVANLSGLLPPPGISAANNGVYLTPGVTVFNDSSIDTVAGGAGNDLYLVSWFGTSADRINDGQTNFSATVNLLITGA